jgi:SAM-dependent methyltransferase
MAAQLRRRIVQQFSGRGQRADVWRGLDWFLATSEFLNLGYSAWYQPHVLSSQSRLVRVVGEGLASRLPRDSDQHVLDLGCGRGGSTITLADALGCECTGIDLVPYNVTTASANASERALPVEYCVGDATMLPFCDGAFSACTAIDALVYVPEKARVFRQIARVLRDGGVLAISDLVAADGLDDSERATVDRFAAAWDMPALPSVRDYRETIQSAGLVIDALRDVTAYSLGHFGKYSGLFLTLERAAGGAIPWVLRQGGMEPSHVTAQIRRAHDALPSLRHVLVYART